MLQAQEEARAEVAAVKEESRAETAAVREAWRVERENIKQYLRGRKAERARLQASNKAYRQLLARHGIPLPPEATAAAWVRARHTCCACTSSTCDPHGVTGLLSATRPRVSKGSEIGLCMQAEDEGESTPSPQHAPAGGMQGVQAPAQQAAPSSTPLVPGSSAQAGKVQLAASSPEVGAAAAAGNAQQAGLPGVPGTASAAASQQQQPSEAGRGEHAVPPDRSMRASATQEGMPAAGTGAVARPRSAPGTSGGTKRSADGGRPVLAPPASSAQQGSQEGSQAKRLRVAEAPAPQPQQTQPGSAPQAAAGQGCSEQMACSDRDGAVRQDAGDCEAADDLEEDRLLPVLTATQMTGVTRTLPEGPGSRAVSSRRPSGVDALKSEPAQGPPPGLVQRTAPDQARAGRAMLSQLASRQATVRHAGSQDSVQSSPAPAGAAHAGSKKGSRTELNPGGTLKKGHAHPSSLAEDADAEETGAAGAGPSSPLWQQRKRLSAAGQGGQAPAAGGPPPHAAAEEIQHTADEEGAAGDTDCSQEQTGARPERAHQQQPRPLQASMPPVPPVLEEACKGKWKPRVLRNSTVPGASLLRNPSPDFSLP